MDNKRRMLVLSNPTPRPYNIVRDLNGYAIDTANIAKEVDNFLAQ